jgi:hypothetical protein
MNENRDDEIARLKEIISESCVETARWKVQYESLKLKYEKLLKDFHLKEKESGSVRLPYYQGSKIP